MPASIYWAAARIWDRQTGTVDEQFTANRLGMASTKRRYRLLYWYLENRSGFDQSQQAIFVTNPLQVGEGVMLDAELDCTEQQAWDFIINVEAFTHRPVAVYTNPHVDGGRIWNSRRIFDGVRPKIYPNYLDAGQTVDELIAEAHARKPWDVWQHSNRGTVPGVTTLVDLDQVDGWRLFDPVCGY